MLRTTIVTALIALPALALAEPRPYRGPHPVDFRGNWHLDDSVHVHDDLAVGLDAFAEIDGVHVFLGDPLAYGYTGTTWAYHGAHPLPARIGDNCGIPGVHHHPFPPEGEFRVDSRGAYQYAGARRGGVATHRPRRTRPSQIVRIVATPPVPRVPVVPAVPPTPAVPYGYPAPSDYCHYVTSRHGDYIITTGVGHGCSAPVSVYDPLPRYDRRFGEPIPLVVPRERPPAHW